MAENADKPSTTAPDAAAPDAAPDAAAAIAASATTITEADVRQVAKLSRLKLSDEEVHRYAEQLTHVLGHIAKLNELDVEGVEPMLHAGEQRDVLRDDVPGPGWPTDTMLANAPRRADEPDPADPSGEREQSFFAVPKVLGDGGGA